MRSLRGAAAGRKYAGVMRERMREDLAAAIKAQDRIAIAALRTGLAAIDNAEAVDAPGASSPVTGSSHVAGASAGAGSSDVPRRVLSDADISAIVRAQVAERREAAAAYDKLGRPSEGDVLRGEAAVLDRYLTGGQ